MLPHRFKGQTIQAGCRGVAESQKTTFFGHLKQDNKVSITKMSLESKTRASSDIAVTEPNI